MNKMSKKKLFKRIKKIGQGNYGEVILAQKLSDKSVSYFNYKII